MVDQVKENFGQDHHVFLSKLETADDDDSADKGRMSTITIKLRDRSNFSH